jgi:phosphotransferase system HPr (HPr) family protein
LKIEEQVQVANSLGLHMRPAAEIVKALQSIHCKVRLRYGNREINARSIMCIITLSACYNAKVTIVADGKDARKAISSLKEIMTTNFSEEKKNHDFN